MPNPYIGKYCKCRYMLIIVHRKESKRENLSTLYEIYIGPQHNVVYKFEQKQQHGT